MKILKRLFPYLILLLAVFCAGCSRKDKAEIRKTVTAELDLLKNLDADTVKNSIAYEELFPDAEQEKTTSLSHEIQDVFLLFFQNFDYKLQEISIDSKNHTAEASVRLTTLDAGTLAKHYAASQLRDEIRLASEGTSLSEISLSLEARYLILNHLLKTGEYDTLQRECRIPLVKKDKTYEILRSETLENDLTGGLTVALQDPYILSPADTLEVYLNTLQKMDTDQMSHFTGIMDLLTGENTYQSDVAEALIGQVLALFDYEITDTKEQGYQASVTAQIVTFDSEAILSSYQTELDTYLASPEAVIDGVSLRYEKSHQLLLSHIRENKKTVSKETVFQFYHDGTAWRLRNPGQVLGEALFGEAPSITLPS